MDTTNTVAEIRTSLDKMGVEYKKRDSKSTLLALYATATDGKIEDETKKTYRLTFVNESTGGVAAHFAGCADLKKVGKSNHDEIAYDYDATSQEDATADFNSDFDKETDGWYEIDFKGCTAALPTLDDEITLDRVADAVERSQENTISEWFEKKVGTKWTYIYHSGELIAEVRNDAAKQVMAVLQASA